MLTLMDLAPVLSAIRRGDADAVRDLVEAHPALAQARTPEGVSLVTLACYHRQPEIAEIFAGCGAILDIFDACALGDEARVHALAEQFPASIHAYSPDGFFPLGLAAYFGHRKIVEYLLDAGADVNQAAQNALQVAAIHAAVSHGDIEIVRALIEHHADLNARQQHGITALHAASQLHRPDLVALLLQHGADPEALDDDGKPAVL